MLKLFYSCLLSFVICASVLSQTLLEKVTFKISAPNAKSVSVAGSFNNWNPESNPLIRIDSAWIVELEIPSGYYYYKFVVDGNWITDPSNSLRINDGGDNFNSIIKVGEPPKPVRKKSLLRLPKEKLPQLILQTNPEWVELYYAAWQMAWNKIAYGTEENGFVDSYMDEGFNEMIFQWDTNFMVAFALYARDIFPAIQSLDNFYKKQRLDGYIQRVYWEATGEEVNAPSYDEPMVNPPLFAWIELKNYKMSGDKIRIKKVLPYLVRYYNWIQQNMRDSSGLGLYFNTNLGSGMDNTPRPNVGKAGWIDMSAQQALAAFCIYNLAKIINDDVVEDAYMKKYQKLKELINNYCWNDSKKFYFDMITSDMQSPVKHIGAFWTMLAQIADSEKVNNIIFHLTNKNEFWRPNLIPTLSYDDSLYDEKGHYWLGSVWAPTNYMVVKGLEKYRYYNLANQIANNYISILSDVYFDFKPEENKLAFEERYNDDYNTLWECYSPEFSEPATRWDNTFYSRQDFVGWTGLGPIAMLIENVIGLDLNVPGNKITWRIFRSDEHGIKNLLFGSQRVELICTPGLDFFEFHIYCDNDFKLNIILNDKVIIKEIRSGENIFRININR